MVPGKFPQVAVMKPPVEHWKPAQSNLAPEGPDLVGNDHLAGNYTELSSISAAAATKKSDKAWKQPKTFHGITSANSMRAFSSSQRDQWRALAALDDANNTSTRRDQVP
eukprot:6201148-Pleurochrysis_carterae.AAC.2